MRRAVGAAVGLIAIVWSSGPALAGAPAEKDVEACKKQAEAVTAAQNRGADDRANDRAGTDATATAAGPQQGQRGAASSSVDSKQPSDEVRSAFADCLARRGYYKGYYGHNG